MQTKTDFTPGPVTPDEHFFYALNLECGAKAQIAKHANATSDGRGLTIYLSLAFRTQPNGPIINYTERELELMKEQAMKLAQSYPTWRKNTGTRIAENRLQDLASFDVYPLEEHHT